MPPAPEDPRPPLAKAWMLNAVSPSSRRLGGPRRPLESLGQTKGVLCSEGEGHRNLGGGCIREADRFLEKIRDLAVLAAHKYHHGDYLQVILGRS